MFRPNATIHKSPTGKVTVLACSEDAVECVDAYKDCKKAGEVVYLRKGHLDKRKSISPVKKAPKPEPKETE